jgi:peptidoglycan/xylan/chitin deacetylase (PgdA/CDA1 family)
VPEPASKGSSSSKAVNWQAISMHWLTGMARSVLPGGYWAHNGHKISSDTKPTLNLTYDDGPCKATTKPLLDLLEQEQIKATFFCIGQNIERHPELVREIFERGHTVANHSWDHPFLPTLSRPRIAEQIDRTNDLIQSITGFRPDLFRPPYGIIDGRGARLLKERRMTAVYWGAVSEDWRNIGADNVVAHIMGRLPAAPLIVMHEGDTVADQCLVASRTIISRVKEQGYSFGPIK